jgi:hypothetical protein
MSAPGQSLAFLGVASGTKSGKADVDRVVEYKPSTAGGLGQTCLDCTG